MDASGSLLPNQPNTVEHNDVIEKRIHFILNVREETIDKFVIKDPEKLTREGLESWKKDFDSTVNCPGYSKQLVDVVYSCMVNGLKSLINAFIPNMRLHDFLPHSVGKIKLSHNTLYVIKNKFIINYPPCMLNYNGSTPFPADTLLVSSHDKNMVYKELSQMVKELIVKYTYDLSVLCLECISLDIQSFCNILEGCTRIGVLVINDLRVCVKDIIEVISHPIPVIPVNILRIFDSFTLLKYYVEKSTNTIECVTDQSLDEYAVWYFNALAPNLEVLEIFYDSKVQIDDMPNLKQLSVIVTCFSVWYQFNASKMLEKLSISTMGGLREVLPNVTDLIMFISKFGDNLKEVYVDADLCYTDMKIRRPARKRKRCHDNTQQDDEQKRPHSFHVKKLTLPYPKNKNKIDLYSSLLLLQFKSLEQLIFIDYYKEYYPCPFYYNANPNHTINAPIFLDGIWRVCPDLKTITILRLEQAKMSVNPVYSRSTFARY